MSDIARRLTGMTAAQLREYDFKPVHSAADVGCTSGNIPRDVRLAAGMYSGPLDRNAKRTELRETTIETEKPPKSLLERLADFYHSL